MPASALAGLERLDEELPWLAGFGAFECRLGAGESRVDFTLGFASSAEVRRALLRSIAEQVETEVGRSAWGDVRRRLRRWARILAPELSHFTWVEIDAAQVGADRLSPFVVHSLRECSDEDPERRARETRELVATVLELGGDDELLEGVSDLARRLPDWCAVRHVALREAGGRRLLRVVCRMPVTQAANFARGGGSSSAGTAIRSLVSAVHDHGVVTNVNFDLSPGIGDRVGVEFHLTRGTNEDPRWGRLLDALGSAGLLESAKRRALEAWPSRLTEREASRLHSDAVVRDLVVKVDFDDRRAFQAKAYLTFAPGDVLVASARPGTQTAA